MAIRYIEKSGTWQVYYKDPITKKQISKNFKDKKEAEKENSLILYRLKYEPESFKKEEDNVKVITRTLNNVYEEYLKEKQFNPRDMQNHRYHMLYPLKYLGEKDITTITIENLELVKAKIMNDYGSASTRNKLSIFRTVMYYAAKKRYATKIEFPVIPNANYKQFIPPTTEELNAIFSVASESVQRILVLGAYLGVRVGKSELFQLTWNDVDFDKQLVRVHGSKKNKNAAYREVPIRSSLVPLFKEWHEKDQALDFSYLVHTEKGEAYTEINNIWKRAVKKAGITRNIRPYDLRHAFGTELIAAGVDVGTVAKLMGHSTPTMLLTHYQYVMDKQKIEAIEKLPNLITV